MINIAVLGYGVVGSGVVEIIKKNGENISKKAGEPVSIKYILDIRDFPDSPEKEILTKNQEDIFSDPEVSIVVETIGGIKAAYELTKRALESGRSVVTSNKELVATYGPELMQLASEKKVHYLFEASVGGGIPIIKPLYECLVANEITSIAGILNGTTNYILTSMKRDGKDFQTALKDAQEKGYAEANPSDDIEGKDTCRKIAILSTIAFGEFVDYKNIPVQGISQISIDDLLIAELLNLKVKLLGYSYRDNGKIIARVCPALVSEANALSNVEDVFNAILVIGDSIGEVMFYGRGAGKLPTASAVVADIIDVVKDSGWQNPQFWKRSSEGNFGIAEKTETSFLLRIKVRNNEEARKYINEKLGVVQFYEFEQFPEQLVFKTKKETEEIIQEKITQANRIGSIKEVVSAIRIF